MSVAAIRTPGIKITTNTNIFYYANCAYYLTYLHRTLQYMKEKDWRWAKRNDWEALNIPTLT